MYLRRRPYPLLAKHINYYWCVSDTPCRQSVHVVPSGTLEIVFNLRGGKNHIGDPSDAASFTPYADAVVSGAQGRYFVIDVQAHALLIGVHFRPGGAYALLGVPPGSLSDAHADLDAVWGARADELHGRLCAAAGPEERFRILDGEFTQRLGQAALPRDEVRFALRKLGRTNAHVDSVAADVELSHRRFIALFAEQVGVTPKVFSRVGRFQRTWSLARQGVSRDWAQLALICGYFDQSHLIREFVSLSGQSPTEFLQRSAVAEGHHAALARRQG
jgi:AraC-like DNA-binding protein